MDEWGWEQLRPWLTARIELPVGPLFCIIDGPTRGRPWSGAAARSEFRRLAARAGIRRRFAPHQLRHAHALELAREGVALNIIQRQLGHTNLGTTSIYLHGIDPEEIITAVRARRADDVRQRRTPPLNRPGQRERHAALPLRPGEGSAWPPWAQTIVARPYLCSAPASSAWSSWLWAHCVSAGGACARLSVWVRCARTPSRISVHDRAVRPAGDMMVDGVISLGEALRPLGRWRPSTRTWRQDDAGSRPRCIGVSEGCARKTDFTRVAAPRRRARAGCGNCA